MFEQQFENKKVIIIDQFKSDFIIWFLAKKHIYFTFAENQYINLEQQNLIFLWVQ